MNTVRCTEDVTTVLYAAGLECRPMPCLSTQQEPGLCRSKRKEIGVEGNASPDTLHTHKINIYSVLRRTLQHLVWSQSQPRLV